MSPPLARLEGIHKRFGALTALDGAALEVRPGEVHGVLGENGAGKSTLLNILAGMLRPDAGRVEIDGRAVELRTPRDAWAAGVGMVHQHFTLVPRLTVLENLALGWRGGERGRPAGVLRADAPRLRRRIGEIAARTGLAVPLEEHVERLGVGTRQRVEILKALLRDPRILVLDEPTAVLAPDEVAALLGLLRAMAAEGRAVMLVAHKLDEVREVAHRVTVLRRGRVVLVASRDEVEPRMLTRAMVGAETTDAAAVGLREERAPAPARVPREVVAELEGVRVRDTRGELALSGVSLRVRRGEIVGVAGVEGNGQRELAAVLSGRLGPDEGDVRLPSEIGFVPQDRTHEGLVGDLDLAENVALTLHRVPAYVRGPFLRWPAVRRRTAELLARFDVRASGASVRARALSGGNQQRLVVARELEVARDLLVAENPTRGLDVSAAAFVHAELRSLAEDPGGPGIVVLSTDLDEVLALSDRIVVVTGGVMVPVPESVRTREGVGSLMVGAARA
ncbi:MAG TPA: ABC transporter ATP-binding protein [Longimicrobiales bacterium]|nr:ABC transporter ATP-binding protein [Longimicrobiales bacterium]